jgi:transcriptional regulator NrdR family protein
MAEFRCASCGNPATKVSDVRPTGAFRLRRRRVCKCGHRFSTIELPADEYALLALDGAMVARLHRSARKVTETIDAIMRNQPEGVRKNVEGKA